MVIRGGPAIYGGAYDKQLRRDMDLFLILKELAYGKRHICSLLVAVLNVQIGVMVKLT